MLSRQKRPRNAFIFIVIYALRIYVLLSSAAPPRGFWAITGPPSDSPSISVKFRSNYIISLPPM